ncbi:MAG: LytTR family DNA-binding domain-containing protein [Saprospiraceae bacterium]
MGFRCLIVDDDPLIGDLIKHFCSKSGLVDYCILSSTAADGLLLLAGGDINLIFLDYNLPDMNGQTFLELKKKSTPLIMVTSHVEFAAKSYDYPDIVDFLVKPLSYDRFLKALQRVSSIPVGVSPTVTQDTFYTKDGTKNVRIKLSEVLYIKSEDNYVSWVMPDSQTLSLYSLKDLESKLPSRFKRVHRSYIVNLDQIDYVTSDEITIREKKIPIGEKYKEDLDASLNTL